MNRLRTRVKMCGMTRIEDIAYAVDLGVDAIGLIFYPQSPRYVTVDQAKMLLNNLPPFVDAVAVLVNPQKEIVQELIDELPVNLLQFQGEETPDFCQQFNKPYIKAIRPKAASQIEEGMRVYLNAQAILLDTPSNTHRGGTGLPFDWSIIPEELSKPFILAGGLNELNVSEAIKTLHPYAIDLCSGVESAPGIKDYLKMSQLMKEIIEGSG